METPTQVIAAVNARIDEPVRMMDALAFLDYAQENHWDVDSVSVKDLENEPGALAVIIPAATDGVILAMPELKHGHGDREHGVRHNITYALQPLGYKIGFSSSAINKATGDQWELMTYHPLL